MTIKDLVEDRDLAIINEVIGVLCKIHPELAEDKEKAEMIITHLTAAIEEADKFWEDKVVPYMATISGNTAKEVLARFEEQV